VIEHNLDIIKTADWIIDLGPEGGEYGGQVIAEGTPEAVARVSRSYTGQYLKRILPDGDQPARTRTRVGRDGDRRVARSTPRR
jgi:hypothetical protein